MACCAIRLYAAHNGTLIDDRQQGVGLADVMAEISAIKAAWPTFAQAV